MFFHPSEIEKLNSLGAYEAQIDPSQDARLHKMIDYIDLDCGIMALPTNRLKTVVLPHYPLDHDEFKIDGRVIEDIIVEYINCHFSGEKYIFLAEFQNSTMFKFSKFTYDIISVFTPVYVDHPIIIASSDFSSFFCLDLDFCVSFITGKEEGFDLGGICWDRWNDYYRDNYKNIGEEMGERRNFFLENLIY